MNRLILLVESRIRGDVYVRFGGEHPKTHRSNTAGRWMLSLHIQELQSNPGYVPDNSNSVYLVFMLIGIIGYFTVPTVAGWIVQAGGAGNYGRNLTRTATKAGRLAAGGAGAVLGNIGGRIRGK